MPEWLNDKIEYCRQNEVQYIQFKKLLQYPEIKHCYTLRNNLNFPPITKDAEELKQSYKKISNCLGLDVDKIVKPHQTHTDNVEIVNDVKMLENVDGLLTNKKGLTVLTTSADCTSILIYDTVKKVVGSIHSGWRGTLQGIILKAIEKMKQTYKSEPKDIICCICPTIRQCHFEVDEDVKELFLKKYKLLPNIEQIIKKGRIENSKQKYNIDTVAINIEMLKSIGVQEQNIIDSGICTVCHKELFHSYRADKEKSGRNAALICIKD